MAGFVNGPVGHIVGIGLQAAVGGIPISPGAEKALDVMRNVGLPVPAKNWFVPKNEKQSNNEKLDTAENGVLEFYDNLAADLRGVIKNLTPAMAEMKGVMKKGSKSAEPILRKTRESEILYYSPRNPNPSQKGCPCKPRDYKSSKSGSKCCCKSSKSCAGHNVQAALSSSSSSSSKSSKENDKKSCSKSSHKVCSNKSSKDDKEDKGNKKSSDQLKNCSKCGVNIKVVKMFGLLVCGHTLCHNCIPQNTYNECPICQRTLLSEKLNSRL